MSTTEPVVAADAAAIAENINSRKKGEHDATCSPFFLGEASLPEAAKMEPFPMLDILSLYNRNKKPPVQHARFLRQFGTSSVYGVNHTDKTFYAFSKKFVGTPCSTPPPGKSY